MAGTQVMFTTSVILPTFNERENVTELIASIRASFSDAEIIVVDDNSPDSTGQIVARIAERDARVRLVQRDERGLTSAIQRGVNESHGEVIFWMDCDLTMSPATMLLLLDEIERGADVAIGSRYAPSGKDARDQLTPVAFSVIINLAAKVLLGGPVRDYTTGFVAARRSVLNQITLRGDYGEYCIDFLTRAMRKKFRVVEVGYVYKQRVFGESKTALSFLGFIRRGWPYVTTILRLAFHRHS
jgi:dolichol-phosphate mannosyltransferase